MRKLIKFCAILCAVIGVSGGAYAHEIADTYFPDGTPGSSICNANVAYITGYEVEELTETEALFEDYYVQADDGTYFWDLDNHKFAVRYRYYVSYVDPAVGSDPVWVVSDWSEESSVGLGGSQAALEEPQDLSVPSLSNVTAESKDNGSWWAKFHVDINQSDIISQFYYIVNDETSSYSSGYNLQCEVKIDDGDWMELIARKQDNSYDSYLSMIDSNEYICGYGADDKLTFTGDSKLSIRVRLYNVNNNTYSGWSEVVEDVSMAYAGEEASAEEAYAENEEGEIVISNVTPEAEEEEEDAEDSEKIESEKEGKEENILSNSKTSATSKEKKEEKVDKTSKALVFALIGAIAVIGVVVFFFVRKNMKKAAGNTLLDGEDPEPDYEMEAAALADEIIAETDGEYEEDEPEDEETEGDYHEDCG